MTDERSASEALLDLLGGKARSQAVSTAAALGIPDALADGPLSLDELAARVDCAPARLDSLVRLLVGLGVLRQPRPETFALTEVGIALRADALGPLAAFIGSPEQWDPWSRLRDALRDGPPAFERAHGTDLYGHLATHPEAAQRYDEAIDAFTRAEGRLLSEHYDFSSARHVVDVGGGRGSVLADLLVRWPELRGTLFDLPHVADAARTDLAAVGADRAAAVGGDFTRAVPAGADLYLLKRVLHNWPDEDATRILANCGDALRAGDGGGRLLVVESVLSPDCRPDTAAMLDLEMVVLTGGRVRRKPALRRLVAAAGFAIERLEPLGRGAWLLVATAA